MGQQVENVVQRLRRFARALSRDSDSADALVMAALSSHEDRRLDFNRLLTFIIARRRDLEEVEVQVKSRTTSPSGIADRPEILRAFERLPLSDREVLALISVEGLPYEDAAAVLALREEAFIARLTRARTAFARQIDGERHAVLRIVK